MPEDVSGLPNVTGLESLVSEDNLEPSDKGTPAPETAPETVTVTAPEKPSKTAQPRNELGQFKTSDDLLKGYKEIQGAFTRMAQEKKQTEEQLAQLQEQLDLMRYRQPVVTQQAPPQGKNFDSQFIENPEQAVTTIAQQTVRQQIHTARLAEVLEDEQAKNPQEYQERLAYATQLSQQYPQLAVSAPGVKKLFEMADKYRKVEYQKRGMEFVRAVVGEDVDFEKFKSLVKKDQSAQTQQINNAYMPDTTTSNRTGTEPDKTNAHEAEIQNAVNKGDIDGVLNGLFRKQGLRP